MRRRRKPRHSNSPNYKKSENTQLLFQIWNKKEFWGKAFRFRNILRTWGTKSKVCAPKGPFEVFNPVRSSGEVYSIATRLYIDKRSSTHIDRLFYRPTYDIFTHIPSLERFQPSSFHIFMYDKLVESQFYFRWYHFMHLMADYPLHFHPTQVKVGQLETNTPPDIILSDLTLDDNNLNQKLI